MKQLQPADITPPNINININVPQIGADEEKKKKEDPEEEKVDKITNAIEEIKEKNITIIKPSSGEGEGTLAVEESDSESNTSDNTSKSGGEKKKVTFGGF